MKTFLPRRFILITTLLLLSSCGGGGSSAASAPPVDLPAPITGRIDISEPDHDGNVTITGTDGAVTAGSTVIAVNETVAGAQSLRLLDALIRSAYAQSSFPPVCSEAGKACALADANGAFVIILAASRGDSIVIGLIDPTSGAYVSPLVRTAVPTGDQVGTTSTACAGLNLSGAAVDFVIVPGDGTTITLHQGSDTATNRVVIRTVSTAGTTTTNSVAIDGCYATALAVVRDASDAVFLAATSSSDQTLWTGTYSSGNIWNATSFALSGTPSRVMFVGTSTDPLVAVRSSAGTAVLQKVSLTSGSAGSSMDLGVGAVASVTDLDHYTMSDGQHLGLAIATDTSNVTSLVFFHADNMTVISTNSGDFTIGGNGILWATFIDNGTTLGVAIIANSSDGPYLHIVSPQLGAAGGETLGIGTAIGISGFSMGAFSIFGAVLLSTDSSLTSVGVAVAKNAALTSAADISNNILVPMSDQTLKAVQVQLFAGADPMPADAVSLGFPPSAIAVSNNDFAIDVLNATTGEPSLVGGLFTWAGAVAAGF